MEQLAPAQQGAATYTDVYYNKGLFL
jgi:hypothetical protein